MQPAPPKEKLNTWRSCSSAFQEKNGPVCSDVMCLGCWAQGLSILSRPRAPWTLILGTQNLTGCLHTWQLRGVLHTLISLSVLGY